MDACLDWHRGMWSLGGVAQLPPPPPPPEWPPPPPELWPPPPPELLEPPPPELLEPPPPELLEPLSELLELPLSLFELPLSLLELELFELELSELELLELEPSELFELLLSLFELELSELELFELELSELLEPLSEDVAFDSVFVSEPPPEPESLEEVDFDSVEALGAESVDELLVLAAAERVLVVELLAELDPPSRELESFDEVEVFDVLEVPDPPRSEPVTLPSVDETLGALSATVIGAVRALSADPADGAGAESCTGAAAV